jgi:hypothetical protein
MIRQYDTRLSDQKAYGSPNVLINLATAGPRGGLIECKGVDVNPIAPHLMAVACGDPFVRVFDRRRVGTGGLLGAWLLLFCCCGSKCMICTCINRCGSPNVLINLATAGPRGGLVGCKGVDVNGAAFDGSGVRGSLRAGV